MGGGWQKKKKKPNPNNQLFKFKALIFLLFLFRGGKKGEKCLKFWETGSSLVHLTTKVTWRLDEQKKGSNKKKHKSFFFQI